MLELLARAEKEADERHGRRRAPAQRALAGDPRRRRRSCSRRSRSGPGSFRPHMAALQERPARRRAATTPRRRDARDALHAAISSRARKAGGFDPVIGRDVEVRRLLQILERRQKNHPLLVGEPGVGKTRDRRRARDAHRRGRRARRTSRSSRILELETGLARRRREAARRDRRAPASRCSRRSKAAERERRSSSSNGIDSLLGQGAAGSGVGDLLKPLLARGEVRLLATTTPEGVRKITEQGPGLLRRFTRAHDRAADAGAGDRDPARHRDALRGAPQRADRRSGDRRRRCASRSATCRTARCPTAAIDLLDETAARKRVEIDGVPARGRRRDPPPRVAQGAARRRSPTTPTR